MTHSTFATLGFQGVTGIAFVQLDDTGTDPTALASSPQHVAEVPMRPGLFEQLQQRGDVILKKFERLSDDADKFLSDDVRNQLMDTTKSLKGAADGIATLASQVQPATAQLPQTLSQAAQYHARLDQSARANLNRPDGPFVTNLKQGGQGRGRRERRARGHERIAALRDGARGLRGAAALYSFSDDVSAAARSIDRAADAFSTNPRSVLFGAPQQAPGPGEPGFQWPAQPAH